MSTATGGKAALPSLAGVKLKGRKRDEKVKYDPSSFRNEIVEGLLTAAQDNAYEAADDSDAEMKKEAEMRAKVFDQANIFLDKMGNSLDYRRYSESLFDILIAGGLLAPGGGIVSDGADANPLSVFESEATVEEIQPCAQMFQKLLRRYKYLQRFLEEEEVPKILHFLKGFSPENRNKLAIFFAQALAFGLIPAKPLELLLNDTIVAEGVARDFVLRLMQTYIKVANVQSMTSTLKKGGLDSRIMDFFPESQRTPEAFEDACNQLGDMEAVISFQRAQLGAILKRELKREVANMIQEEQSDADIVARVQELKAKGKITETETIVLLWPAVMNRVDLNSRPDTVSEAALRQVKAHATLLASFARSLNGQLQLLVVVQTYCYDNQILMKSFCKLCLLLYNVDVVGEDAILEWHAKSHSPKGKSAFLAQMKKMIDWLKTAEEEPEGEGQIGQ